jgi:hypothetical protein
MGGVYTMTATVPGCGTVQRTVPITIVVCKYAQQDADADASVEAIAEGQAVFMVYPNPSEGEVQAILKQAIKGAYRLEVLDMLGHTVLVPGKEDFSAEPSWKLNFSNLPKGTYLIRLTGEGLEMTERVLIR